MINWPCSQCDETLEAPNGFTDVIECPECGHHSRPVKPPASTRPVKSPAPSRLSNLLNADLLKGTKNQIAIEKAIKASQYAKKPKAERRFNQYTVESSWVYRIGGIMCAAAVFVLWYAIAMNTTNGNVHHTGLMNNRVVVAIIGSALFMTGGIGIALGAISTGIIRLMLDSTNKTSE